MAAQLAPAHTGRADQVPALQVRVVEPLTTPLGHEMIQVLPLEVLGQVPVPYCVGGLLICGHVGATHTGSADHAPLLHVSVVEPDCTP